MTMLGRLCVRVDLLEVVYVLFCLVGTDTGLC